MTTEEKATWVDLISLIVNVDVRLREQKAADRRREDEFSAIWDKTQPIRGTLIDDEA